MQVPLLGRPIFFLILFQASLVAAGDTTNSDYVLLSNNLRQGILSVREIVTDKTVSTTHRFFPLANPASPRSSAPYTVICTETVEGKPLAIEVKGSGRGDLREKFDGPSTSNSLCLLYKQRLLMKRLLMAGSGETFFHTYSWEKRKPVLAKIQWKQKWNDNRFELHYYEEDEPGYLILYVDAEGTLIQWEHSQLNLRLVKDLDAWSCSPLFERPPDACLKVVRLPRPPLLLKPGERCFRLVASQPLRLIADTHQRVATDTAGTTWVITADQHRLALPPEKDLQTYKRFTTLIQPLPLTGRASAPGRLPEEPLKLCETVDRHFQAKATNGVLLDALAAWQAVIGDCSEHAVTLTALARQNHYPARLVFGLMFGNDGAPMWHLCTQLYHAGSWQLYDATVSGYKPMANFLSLRLIHPQEESEILNRLRPIAFSITKVVCYP
jgi:hypothetical protein